MKTTQSGQTNFADCQHYTVMLSKQC